MIQTHKFSLTISPGTGPSGAAGTTPVAVQKVQMPNRGFLNDIYVRFSSGWFYAFALSSVDPNTFSYLEYGGPNDILDEVGFYSIANLAILNASLTEMRISHAMKSTTSNGWCLVNEPYTSDGVWFYVGPLAGVLAPVTVDIVVYSSPLTASVI